MHPFLSDNRKLLGYVLAWLLIGVLVAALFCWTGEAEWIGALLFALPLSVVFGFAALSAYYVCRALPYERRRPLNALGRFGAAALVYGSAWLLLGLAWNGIGQMLLGAGRGLVHLEANARLVFFIAGAGLYLLSLLAHDVLIAFENVRDATERAAAMRTLAREAELQMLRAQIDPHFLFNSLNSICALIGIDPDGARAMTIDLAEFFRRTQALSSRDLISLREEMALCEHFLAIEKRRFGARLEVELHIDDAAGACLLPPMSLQPLIENALKHGIRHLAAGGMLRVSALVRDGWLHLSVSNPVGDGVAPVAGNGMGLKNLRERLALRYDTRARLDWRREDACFRVDMTLPWQEEGEA
jgi:hypothetical protein